MHQAVLVRGVICALITVASQVPADKPQCPGHVIVGRSPSQRWYRLWIPSAGVDSSEGSPGAASMGGVRWLGPGNTGIGAVHKTPKWQVWVEKQFRGF